MSPVLPFAFGVRKRNTTPTPIQNHKTEACRIIHVALLLRSPAVAATPTHAGRTTDVLGALSPNEACHVTTTCRSRHDTSAHAGSGAEKSPKKTRTNTKTLRPHTPKHTKSCTGVCIQYVYTSCIWIFLSVSVKSALTTAAAAAALCRQQ